MNEKKNIDRLFQEKFKDFEVTPPDFVWENIQEALQEKKKRRVVPLWMRLSGVAAILAVGFVFLTPYFNGIDEGDTPIVIDNNGQQGTPLQANPEGNVPNNGAKAGDTDSNPANSAVAAQQDAGNPVQESTGSNTSSGVASPATKRLTEPTTAVAHSGNSHRASKNNKSSDTQSRNAATGGQHEIAAVTPGNSTTGNSTKLSQPVTGSGIAQSNPAVTTEPQEIARVSVDKENHSNASGLSDPGSNSQGSAIADNNRANGSGITSENPDMAPAIDTAAPVTGEAVAETTVDTTSAIAAESELEKAYREMMEGKKDDEQAVAQSDKGKWNVRPQVAPVFYNSLSSGSPIDAQFAGNSKSYDNDLSVGLGIDYAINDRISIRTGVNTLNLSYATNDIQFHASLNASTTNIAPGGPGSNIVVVNPAELVSIDGELTTTYQGAMVQETGYIEVPLEMSYALVNKKFGIDVIGGVSTLFLNENSVSVVSDQGLRSDIGQAQNLNDIHFTTNVGIGFKYKFWNSFEANFEPMFKYQMNAYSRDAGNFRPYFIGLYSGISFRF